MFEEALDEQSICDLEMRTQGGDMLIHHLRMFTVLTGEGIRFLL